MDLIEEYKNFGFSQERLEELKKQAREEDKREGQ